MPRILIVDDEPTVRRILALALNKGGFEVDAAPNGQAALERIRVQAPDAVITDIEMPRMDGQTFCEQVGIEFPERDFPIFVLTSLTAHEHRVWSRAIPDLHFLEKPVSARKLHARLTEVLAEQRNVTEAKA